MNSVVRVGRSLFRRFVEKTLLFFSRFVPNEEELVLFSMSRGRYWDNSRALFEYMAENTASSVKVVWLTDSDMPVDRIPAKYKNRFVPRHSPRGWVLCAKAQVVIICYSFGDFGVLREVAKRKQVVMLWHAITTKYCGLLDEKFDAARRQRYQKKETIFYDLLIASSDIDRYYSASYTGVDVNAIAVTGLPRNDRLFRKEGAETEEKDHFSILYAPTFRDYPVEGGSLLFPFSYDAKDIAGWARQASIRFFLRPHPSDVASIDYVQTFCLAHPDVFEDGGVANYPDVMELLLDCDAIVTDYSSTYVDGLILDRPVTFIDHDRERYMKTRGLAYDYDLITPGPKVRSWPEFQRACEEMAAGADAWAEHREFVRNMFFKYRDAHACARVSALIEDMVTR